MSDAPDARRMTAYFDHSPDSILIVDPDGRIVRANQRVTDMFGYEPDELQGEPVERLVPDADREGHVAQRESYMADPERRSMGAGLDLRARRKDGSTFPADISLSPIDAGGETEVMAVVRDIAEQSRLRRKYRSLLDTAPDAVFVADADTGEIIEVNESAVDLMGVPESELVGSDQRELHPDGDGDRYRDLFRSHIDDGVEVVTRFPDGDDLYVATADGTTVPVEISASVTRLDGRPVVIGLFRDISERKAYERDLEAQLERFETLARLTSHDLRNPLNVAQGRVDLARETGELDHLDAVASAHDRMTALLDDVLTIVREGYEVETVEPVELSAIARQCWRNVRTDDATLRVESDAAICANPDRLRHVFENLFRNSMDHVGGDVTIRVGVLDDESGFYVEDDGPGIPVGDREDVFDPGFSTATDGTGLGLNIVREIAEAHAWDVTVEDGRDGGARFEFTRVTFE